MATAWGSKASGQINLADSLVISLAFEEFLQTFPHQCLRFANYPTQWQRTSN